MQCPHCLCSSSRDVEIAATRFKECSYCGNLMDPEPSGPVDLRRELEALRGKLEGAEAIVDRILRSSVPGH